MPGFMHILNAQIDFRVNQGSLNTAVGKAQSSLQNVHGTIKFDIDPKSQAQIAALTASTKGLQEVMKGMGRTAIETANQLERVGTSLSRISSYTSSAITGMQSMATSTRQASSSAQEGGYNFNEFGRQIAIAGRRFAAFTVAASVMYAFSRSIRDGISEAIEFDLSLNKLRQVSGDTASQVGEISKEVMRLSTNLGVASTELADSAVTLRQAGLSLKDTQKALEGIAQASLAPNFKDMKQITEGAIAAYQQFGKDVDGLKDKLGAMNAVAGDFAVEASDLVSAVQKAGGTAAQTGTQFNELLAIFTSVRSTTRESADSIATGLRTIFTRLQRNDTVESLKALNIHLRYTTEEAKALGQINLTDQFVGGYEAVRRLSEGLSKLRTTDPRFSAILEQLGGYRQVSRVIPMIQQFGEAQKALNSARLGSASIETAAGIRQDSIATKIAKVREEFQKLMNELVQSKGFKSMVDGLTSLASGLIKVLDALKPLLPMLIAMGTLKILRGASEMGTGIYQGLTGHLGEGKPRAKFSTGGNVSGSGSGDTVPAMLEPREFVINRQAAQKLGSARLHYMNKHGEIPHFAKGGPVDEEFEGRFNDARPDLMKPLRTIHKFAKKTEPGLELNDLLSDAVIHMRRVLSEIKDLPKDFVAARKILIEETIKGVRNQYRTDERDPSRTQNVPLGFDPKQHGTTEAEWANSPVPAAHRTTDALKAAVAAGVTPEEIHQHPQRVMDIMEGEHLVGRRSRAEVLKRAEKLGLNDDEMVARLDAEETPFQKWKGNGHPTGLVPFGLDNRVTPLAQGSGFIIPQRPALNEQVERHASPEGWHTPMAWAGYSNEERASQRKARRDFVPYVPPDTWDEKAAAGRPSHNLAPNWWPAGWSPSGMNTDQFNGGIVGRHAVHRGPQPDRMRYYRDNSTQVNGRRLHGESDEDYAHRLFLQSTPYGVADSEGTLRIANPTSNVQDPYNGRRYGVQKSRSYRTVNPDATIHVAGNYTANDDKLANAANSRANNQHAEDMGRRRGEEEARAKEAADHTAREAYIREQKIKATTSKTNADFDGDVTKRPGYGDRFVSGIGGALYSVGNRLGIRSMKEEGIRSLRDDRYNDPRHQLYQEHLNNLRGAGVSGSEAVLSARKATNDFVAQKNKEKHLKNYSEDDVFATQGERALDAIKAKGGMGKLSKQTISATVQAEEDKLRQELVAGIKKQIQAQIKGIASAEALKMAEDEATHALMTNAKVLKDSTGRIVGTAARGAALAEAGAAPTGRNRMSDFFATRFGAVGRGAGAIGSRIGANALGIGMLASPIIASHIDPTEDQIKNAAAGGSNTVSRDSGASGALQGAAMGGMIGGPWGAVIGAALGLANGLDEADKKIREVKIANSLTKLGEIISDINNSKDVAGGNRAGMLTEMGNVNKLVSEKAYDSSHSFLDKFDFLTSRQEKDENVASTAKRTFREAYADKVGGMQTTLTKHAEELGKKDTTTEPVELTKKLNLDEVSAAFMQTVAQFRSVPLQQVLRETTESIKNFQEQTKALASIEKGKVANEQIEASFGRLASAVENAASSFGHLQTQMGVTEGVFHGGVLNIKPTSIAAGFNSMGKGNPYEFNQSVGVVGRMLGPDGAQFSKSAVASNQISNFLPGVLKALGESGLSTGESVGQQAKALLYSSVLPGMKLEDQEKHLSEKNPELYKGLTSVIGEITKHVGTGGDKLVEFNKQLSTDPTKLAETLEKEFNGPIMEAGQRLGKTIDEFTDIYADRISRARQMSNTIGESTDRISDIHLAHQRAAAEIASDKTGVPVGATLSLPELLNPFNERQTRLSGGFDEKTASDPGFLGGRLSATREEIKTATTARDMSVGDEKHFAAATANLDKLTSRAANLEQALKHLADVSGRAAILQEKLNALTANRDSRRSFTEKFMTASPEERFNMQRGRGLLEQLDAGKAKLTDFSDEERRLAIQSGRDLGNTVLGHGRTGNAVINNALDMAPGAQDKGQQAELADVQAKMLEVFKSGEEAQKTIVQFQKDTQTDFLTKLREVHEQFFTRLKGDVAREMVAGQSNQVTGIGVEVGNRKKEAEQALLLKGIGIDSQEGLNNARKKQKEIGEFFAARGKIKTFDDERDQQNSAIGNAKGGDAVRGLFETGRFGHLVGIQDKTRKAVNEMLNGTGVSPEDGGNIADRVLELRRNGTGHVNRYQERLIQTGRDRGVRSDELDEGTKLRVLREVIQEAAQEPFKKRRVEAVKNRDEAAEKLGGFRDAIEAVPEAKEAEVRKTIAESFTDASKGLDTLKARTEETATKLAEAAKQLKLMAEQVENINSQEAARRDKDNKAGSEYRNKLDYKAEGGPLARGTDTIPAMLSPNEFVVNAQSAKANASLLNKINRAKVPIYRADGGSAELNFEQVVAKNKKEIDEEKEHQFNIKWHAIRQNQPPFEEAVKQRQAEDAEAARIANAPANAKGLAVADPFGPIAQAKKDVGGGLKKVIRMQQIGNAKSLMYEQSIARSGGLPGQDGQLNAASGAVSQQRAGNLKMFNNTYGHRIHDMQEAEAAAVGKKAAIGVRKAVFAKPNIGNVALGESRRNPVGATGEFAKKMAEIKERLALEAQQRSDARDINESGFTDFQKKMNAAARRRRDGLGTNVSSVHGGLERVKGFASGGMVRGSGSGDCVPAMLEPGEMVIPKNHVQRFAQGGLVGGQGGGGAGAIGLDSAARDAMMAFSAAGKDMVAFGRSADGLSSALRTFNTGVDKLAGFIEKFPTHIELTGNFTTNVNINGAEALAQMEPHVKDIVVGYVDNAIKKAFDNRVPDASNGLKSDPTRVS